MNSSLICCGRDDSHLVRWYDSRVRGLGHLGCRFVSCRRDDRHLVRRRVSRTRCLGHLGRRLLLLLLALHLVLLLFLEPLFLGLLCRQPLNPFFGLRKLGSFLLKSLLLLLLQKVRNLSRVIHDPATLLDYCRGRWLCLWLCLRLQNIGLCRRRLRERCMHLLLRY